MNYHCNFITIRLSKNSFSENSKTKFNFSENHYNIQIGNGYLEFDIKIRRSDGNNFAKADVMRLFNNAFAHSIHDARISNSFGVEIEQKKFVGLFSNMMTFDNQKDGDLSTYFDIIDKCETKIDISSLKQVLINNHTDDNKGIIRGHLPPGYIFAFCKSFKK